VTGLLAGTPLDGYPVVSCAGVPVTACTPGAAARAVVQLASTLGPCAAGPDTRKPGADVHLCAAYTLAVADREPDMRDLLRRASLNLPDGKGVVWANQIVHRGLGLPGERVYGPDLFRAVLRLGQPVRLRHYLLGSTPDVLAALRASIRRDYPDALVVGTESPPFRPLNPDERRAQVDRLRGSGAQVVWVGLGTPKQDREAARLAGQVPAVFVAVGAAFDFVAGRRRQAPAWIQRNGLEWMFRLASEPRRLWRRYLFGNARFVYAVARRLR
jgi:N-acetylglucosaminyldiphosphoundecaprenol N-acetyl-beta-D-mannosaminyltransferase